MNILETIIVISIILSIFIITYQFISEKTNLAKSIIIDYTRFQAGRTLIKYLTENSSITNDFCDLNITKIDQLSIQDWLNILDNLSIKFPAYVSFEYLNGSIIKELGGTGDEYYEFKRICKAGNSLVIVRVRI